MSDTIKRTDIERIINEAREDWQGEWAGKPQREISAMLLKELAQKVSELPDAGTAPKPDDGTWTVLGIWDNDEAIPIGAIAGRHDVCGESPGDRLHDELRDDPNFCGFSTSSFYEQGVWAVTVTAADADAAQDLAAREMMSTLNDSDNPDDGEEN
jgi:hypothetical protein